MLFVNSNPVKLLKFFKTQNFETLFYLINHTSFQRITSEFVKMNQSKKHQVPRNLNDNPDCYKNHLLQNIQINIQVFQFGFRRVNFSSVHTSSNVEKTLNVRAVFRGREFSLQSGSLLMKCYI